MSRQWVAMAAATILSSRPGSWRRPRRTRARWRRASASRCRRWKRPPLSITNTVAATSTAASAMSTTAATWARIPAAAARAYSRRELMVSTGTPEVRIARERPQAEGFQVSPVSQLPLRGLPQCARRLDAPPFGGDLLLDDVAEVDQVRRLADAILG